MNDVEYLQRTHDAQVFDVHFDGATLTLSSETWVGTNPDPPEAGKNFSVIFSRYVASFSGVRDLDMQWCEDKSFDDFDGATKAFLEKTGLAASVTSVNEYKRDNEPRIDDLLEGEIFRLTIAGGTASIETDAVTLTFDFSEISVQRFPPEL